MKDYSLLLTIASLVTLSSCVSPTTSTGGSMSNSQESSSITNSESVSESVSINENADYIVSEIKTLENGKTYLEVDGKMVGVSVGEKRGDTLIVHVEKALYEYSGAYPTLAQEFAKAFAVNEIEFINREDDSGDLGLRTSKTQYQPIFNTLFLDFSRVLGYN